MCRCAMQKEIRIGGRPMPTRRHQSEPSVGTTRVADRVAVSVRSRSSVCRVCVPCVCAVCVCTRWEQWLLDERMPFVLSHAIKRIIVRLLCTLFVVVFFEEKRILRRKRTGTPDHTRDSHSATKRERDVDTAKLKAGGVLTGGRLGPLQGGPRAKAKCGAGRAKRGGAGCS